MKSYARNFYLSSKWTKCRKAYFKSQFGICERCGKPGLIVHHKVYITEKNISDDNITLNFENLELLCQDCHNKEHKLREKSITRDDLMFDNDGNLIKIDKKMGCIPP